MAVAHSRVTVQGQISVPAEIRRRLGLGPGAVLEWQDEDGRIVVRRAGTYSSADVHGALFPHRVPVKRTLPELKAGVPRYIKRRHARR